MTTTELIHDLANRDTTLPNPRRNGKIARLPKETRDMINHMIDDGLPARVIIDELGETGHGLNAQNITNWVHGGYQDYVRHQEALDRARIQAEYIVEFLRETGDVNPADVQRACQIVAGVQVLEALKEHGDQALANMLQHEPKSYLPLVNTVAHMSNAALKAQKHQDALAFRQVLGALRAASSLTPPAPPLQSSPIKINQASTLDPQPTTLNLLPPPPPQSSQIKVNQASTPQSATETPAQPSVLPTTTAQSSPIKVDQASTLKPQPTTLNPLPASPAHSETETPSEPSALATNTLQSSQIKANQAPPANP